MSKNKNRLIAATALLIHALFAASPNVLARTLPEFSGLVETYGPSVVNISTKHEQTRRGRPSFHGFSLPDLPEGSPLQDLFRHFFGEEGLLPYDENKQSRSLGSGFFISADGYLLTNFHVVEGADEIIVRTSDRREFLAGLVGTDKRSDIALLKVEAQDLPPVVIGTAKDLKVGEWVLAIGSPFGFDHSATAGIVSAKGRNLPSENYVPFIQTDVAINPGNSGGPLFDLDGKVVGVNSQIYSRTGGFMGLSFAIPIDMVMDVVGQLKAAGRVSRGWLGVRIQAVTKDLAETFGMDQPRGALVAQLLPDSPAEKSDLREGDVILRFNGKSVTTFNALPPLVAAARADESARLEVLRDGEIESVTVVVGELPDKIDPTAVKRPQSVRANSIGLVLEDLNAEQRERLGQGGVIVREVKPGAAERVGISPGDLILMFDGRLVEDTRQLRELLAGIEAGRSVAVLVQRNDRREFYAVHIPEE